MSGVPIATAVLLGANVLMFFVSAAGGGLGGVGEVHADLGLFGPAIDLANEWWRIFTSGFLHVGLIHIGFNMFLLWQLGKLLEPGLGTLRFVVLYVTSLLSGSFGALLVDPLALTVGASGAVFGLMGAAFVILRNRGFDPWRSGLGGLIVINVILTFTISSISVGGHIGGLAGGALAGLILAPKGRQLAPAQSLAAVAAIGVAAFFGALWAAGTWTDPVF